MSFVVAVSVLALSGDGTHPRVHVLVVRLSDNVDVISFALDADTIFLGHRDTVLNVVRKHLGFVLVAVIKQACILLI